MTTDKNFRADGPGTGFLARADSNDGMQVGVRGEGSSGFDVAPTIGVLGRTTRLDGALANGTGVRGETFGGTGVAGSSGLGGVGVAGAVTGETSGVGVRGSVDTGTAVEGRAGLGIGVFGAGSTIGIQGTGDRIGVLGGGTSGRALSNQEGPFGIGVVGNAIGDVRAGDVPFAYGAWLDPRNGTAPLHLEPSTENAPPVNALRGDLFVDSTAVLWFCTDSGSDTTTATWRRVQLA
jgi:hypothetical protein